MSIKCFIWLTTRTTVNYVLHTLLNICLISSTVTFTSVKCFIGLTTGTSVNYVLLNICLISSTVTDGLVCAFLWRPLWRQKLFTEAVSRQVVETNNKESTSFLSNDQRSLKLEKRDSHFKNKFGPSPLELCVNKQESQFYLPTPVSYLLCSYYREIQLSEFYNISQHWTPF